MINQGVMKKILCAVLAVLAGSFMLSAQNSMLGSRLEKSPELNSDGTVTFRYYAPKAVTVQIRGDFLPKQMMETDFGKFEVPIFQDMTEGEDGVWTFTSDVLEPEFYSYLFVVDGRPVLDPSNIHMTRDISTYTNCFIVSEKNGDKGYLYSVNEVPHGTVSKVWYDSPTLGCQRRMTVYTPPGYDSKGRQRYPVVYLLHGGGNDEDAWQEQGRACQILDNLISSGKAEPMIVVMPNGNAVQQAAPGEGPDGLAQPDMSASGAEGKATIPEALPDVIKYVDANYRTIADKEGRAMCGLSMGGFQTFYTTMDNPDMIGWIGLFSPGPLIDWGSKVPAIEQYRNNPEIVSGLKKVFEAKPYLYWLGMGTEDPHYQDLVDLDRYLTENGYEHEYFEGPGAHEWRVWRQHFAIFIQKIF